MVIYFSTNSKITFQIIYSLNMQDYICSLALALTNNLGAAIYYFFLHWW